MKLIISLNNDYHPDTSIDATIEACNEKRETVGRVIFQFDADGTGDHRILLDFGYPASLSYFAQAQIIAKAAAMVDSYFDDEADTYSKELIEV